MGKAEIAKKIRDARKAKGLTQADVAKVIGVTPQAISNFERGKNRISNDILRSLCEIYGISADLILDNTLAGKVVINENGVPDIQWEYSNPIRPWIKENQKYCKDLYERLKNIPDLERLEYVTKEIEQINPSEIEFFLAKKLFDHTLEDMKILEPMIDSLPDDIVLRIENVKTALIAGLNVKKNKLPW